MSEESLKTTTHEEVQAEPLHSDQENQKTKSEDSLMQKTLSEMALIIKSQTETLALIEKKLNSPVAEEVKKVENPPVAEEAKKVENPPVAEKAENPPVIASTSTAVPNHSSQKMSFKTMEHNLNQLLKPLR